MWNQYFTVTTIQEALELLDTHREHARIIAGGTDILLELHHAKRPDVDILIDVSRVAGLHDITLVGQVFTLGAMVTHNQVVADQRLREKALPLVQASWEVGAPQIRNRATIAGNLITASSANDTITPLLALSAEVTLTSLAGERTIALKDFYTGLRKTVMRPDEMLTSIAFPALTNDEQGVFLKLGLRRAQAISVVNTAVVIRKDASGIIDRAMITLGSVAPTVIHVPVAEQALLGRSLTAEVISEVARLASQTPDPIDDVRSTAQYRTEMIKVLVARALRMLASGTQFTVPAHPALLDTPHRQIALDHAYDNQQPIQSNVNGKIVKTLSGQDKTLLNWLRDDVGLLGTKEGCAEGECGACTVILDGAAVMACMIASPRAHGATITTIEGLSDHADVLHPIQDAFVELGAVQCGYCTPGFVVAGAKLLEEHPHPTKEQIEQSISGNLCRCTGYYKIIQAFEKASK